MIASVILLLVLLVILVPILFARFASGTSTSGTPSASSSTDTEFTAEVVRITQILPHPNADKLELARFEMKGVGETGYEVVVQKGTAKVGDLMAYFSVDCILPLSHPDFKFLGERLDGKDKTHYRLRATRLRGVFSRGLLVPLKVYPAIGIAEGFGDQVAEAYGVTYYRADEPTTGTSISRNDRRINRNAGQPMPIYGVESLNKVPRLFTEGERVAVTEKIHGTNFRFGWVRKRLLGIPVGWKFVVGSHRVMKGLNTHGYYGEDLWSKAATRMNLAAKTAKHKGKAFYGELYGFTYSGQRIQDMTYGRDVGDGPGLAIFDVRDGGKWLGFEERVALLNSLGLPKVPLLTIEQFHPAMLSMAEGQTVVGSFNIPPHIREGIVIESLEGPRRKAKYVGQGYLLRRGA